VLLLLMTISKSVFCPVANMLVSCPTNFKKFQNWYGNAIDITSNHRAAEQYAYCWVTLFSWFYSLLKLLAIVSLFAPCTVLQTWHHTYHGPPRVSRRSTISQLWLGVQSHNKLLLMVPDSSQNELSIVCKSVVQKRR